MNLLWILLFTSLSSVIKCVFIKENGYREITISLSEKVLKEHEFDFLKLKDILRNASDILFHATKKRSYFEDFLLVVPSTFTKEKDICEGFVSTAPKNIDIYVADSSDISGITTRHSNGCGKKGEIIYLSKEWMAGNTEDLAIQFVQQWSTFRYGVFAEDPERDGSCIASSDSTWFPTGCYNIDLNEEVHFDNNGLPLCVLPEGFREREDLHSSIMFSSANSFKVRNFCDGESFPHNPVAPTLHNRICNGNSVWSVIKNTEDFKYGRNLPVRNLTTLKKTKFRCFRESETHLTIVIQNTDSKGRPEIRHALLYFFTIIEPGDFTVSLATFSSSSKKDDKDFINIALEDKDALKSLLESRVTLNEDGSDVCLTCGLQKAYKVAATSRNSLRTIVLIARESSLENTRIPEMLEIMQRNPNIVLHILFLEDTPGDIIPSSLVEAMQKNRGRIFRLKNETEFMLTELTSALLEASKNNLHIEDKVLVVHKKTYVNVTSDIKDVFMTPKNTKGKLFYSVQFRTRGDLKNVNDTCADMDTDLQSPVCGKQITISDDENTAKVWEYFFRYVAGSEGTTCSSLALLKLDRSSKYSFTLKGWLSENKIIPSQNALVIYAEVYNRMDYDVKVKAIISGPGMQNFSLELRDNGNGDPDIIKGDDIYSRYFTSFSQQGTYTVSIIAEAMVAENDNMDVKENYTSTGMNVTQTKVIGTFRVMETPPKEDILPPNRVGDLKILSIDSVNKTVLLQWTAPGDNYDWGTANEYKMYLTEDWKNLEEEMFNKVPPPVFNTSEIKPKINGYQEIEMFQLPETPKVNFIALKATDKTGNEGKISNIVQVVIHNLLINNVTQYNDTENITDTITNYLKDDADLYNTKIHIISGTVSGIIFLIIMINILIWISCFRKYKNRHHATKIKDVYNGKRGNDINSDESILQSETENNQLQELADNQETINQIADKDNPMVMYAKIQKRNINQESKRMTYTNENFKTQEISHHKENDLGFV